MNDSASPIIVIHFDAISLRYLGCYGNEWLATPAIDRLAHESMVFDNCFASLDLAGRSLREQVLDSAIERRQEVGVSSWWGTSEPSISPPAGAKFLSAADADLHPLEGLFARAALWTEAPDRSRDLLWLDVGLAPASWKPTEDRLAEQLEEKEPFDLFGKFSGIVEQDLTLEELDALRDTYAARISELDSYLAYFFESLRASGAWNKTTLILSAEQGWPLGEHDAVGLCRPWIYEERDHVPLIIKRACATPDAPQEGRSPSLVTPADLGPTIDDVLGVDPVSIGDERSLLPLLEGSANGGREFLVARVASQEFSLRTTPWKLILPVGSHPEERRRELYAKPEDRFEVNDLVEQRLDIADHLELQLWRYLDARARGTIDFLPRLRKDIISTG